MLKFIARLLLATAVLYALLVGGVYSFQQKILFRPDKLTSDYQFDFSEPFEEHYFLTKDGVRINALLFPTQNIKKGVVLYLHGNADNLQRWGKYQIEFTKRGYDAFAIDYRGYGKSGGEVSEEGMYSDALAAYQTLRKNHEAEEIIIFGRSLGTSVAAWLASKVEARMLILETPFENMRNLMHLQSLGFLLPFNFKYQFSTNQYLANVPCPIVIFHGTQDKVTPYQTAEALKKVLKKADQFVAITGGRHRGLRHFSEYQNALDRLLGIDEFDVNPSVQ